MLLMGVFRVMCSFENAFGRYPSFAATKMMRDEVKKELGEK